MSPILCKDTEHYVPLTWLWSISEPEFVFDIVCEKRKIGGSSISWLYCCVLLDELRMPCSVKFVFYVIIEILN
ncbi:hypothetical protein RB195_021295 [Necator americanus]|uniref:Uncharacterized protein n=1 Tax=Necator americanus TaxID=51031 RepID=A0ABR1EAL0_NECAM